MKTGATAGDSAIAAPTDSANNGTILNRLGFGSWRRRSGKKAKLALAGWALLLFLIAAAGGAFLNLNYHWKMLPLPKGLIVGHAAIAVAGFVLLLAAAWAATRA